MLPIEQNLESQTHGTELTIGFGATDVWIFLLERSYDFGRARWKISTTLAALSPPYWKISTTWTLRVFY